MALINFRQYKEKESQKSIDDLSRYMQFQKFCAFCGKTRKEVKSLIVGPGVCICDECVEMSHKIINNDRGDITG